MKKASVIIIQLFCLVVFLSFSADAQSNCTYTVNPNSFVVPISGGNYSLDITTQDGCAWTVTPIQSTRPPSISFTSPTSGTGSGKVDFTVAANTTPSIREGGISVRSSDFTSRASVEIVQDVQCADPMFSPSVVNVPAEGSTELNFGWSPSSVNCSYITVRSNDSWITLTGTAPESRYTFSVAPNTGPARTGTISIIINTRVNTYQKIGTLTVNQAAGQSNCTYSYTRTPSETAFPGVPLTITVTAITQPGCVWSTTPNYESSNTNFSWVTFPEGNSRTGSGTITIAFSRNPGISRGVFFTFPGNYNFPISQAKDCSFPFSASQTFPASGGTGNIDIIFPHHDCGIYSFQSSDSWITRLTPSYTGPGNSSRQFQVAPNNGPARTGTVTVLTAQWATSAPNLATTITINQEAGQTNCTYSLDPASQGFPGGGGNGTFNVITQAGCNWTATPSDSWITISGGNSGSGSGSVSFSVGLNFSPHERGGKITINNQTFFIFQNRHCNVGVTPGTISAPSIGQTGLAQVVTSSGSCSYTVSSNVPWITITSGERGAGIEGFRYKIDPNNSITSRTGTITVRISSVEFSTITVNQGGSCTSSISPNSVNIQPSGGRGSVSVTAPPDCAWTAASNVDWIAIVDGFGADGNGVIHYTVQPNSGETRTGTISIGSQILTVTQSPVSCTYTLNPTDLTIPPNGGNYSLNITTQPGCAWNANYSSSTLRPISLTFTSATSGIGSGKLDFTIAPNTDMNTREGDIFVNTYIALKMIQDQNCGAPIFNPSNVNIPGEGGQGSFSWTPNSVNCSVLTTRSNDLWITLTGTNSEGRHTFSVAPNTGPARTGTISISVNTRLNTYQSIGTLTVNQAGQQTCTYSLNPASTQAVAAGGETGFNITTETGCNWTAQSNASWITVSNTTGSGSGRVNYSVQSNTGQARTGTITAGNQTFTVNQDAVSAPVELIRASGRVIDANFKSIRGAIVSFTNIATGERRTTTTNHFGYFHFANIERGQPYSIAISHKRYKFTTRTVIYNTSALIPIYNPDPEP